MPGVWGVCVRVARGRFRRAAGIAGFAVMVLCASASASTVAIHGGSVSERTMPGTGDVCETFEFVDVPITSGVTTYTAYVTDTVLGATVAFPGVYSTSPPYSSDHIVYDGATFNAPAGSHQIPLAEVGAHGPCASEAGRFGLIKVVGTTSCSASSGAHMSPAVAGIASAASSCGLDVTAVPLKAKITSGLGDDGGPAFIGSAHGECVSGCTTILVTVKNQKTHKRVEGATVVASVQPIVGAVPYPGASQGVQGYLCNARAPTSCGTGGFHDISGLKTDKHGQVKLTYWAPAVLRRASTLLTVKATKRCSARVCSRGEKHGEATPNPSIVVLPHLIYHHTGTLTLEQAMDLAAWTEHGTPGHVVASHAAIKLLEEAIKALIAEEKLAELAGSATGGVLTIAHLTFEEFEERGFMAIFLRAFHLRETGLGDGAPSGLVLAPATSGFLNAFAGQGGITNHGGLLWHLGQQLALYASMNELRDQALDLQVYEVSYCEQGAVCGPAYKEFGARHPGIHPYLYIDVSSDQSSPFHSFRGAFVVPYNAKAWMRTQFGPGN